MISIFNGMQHTLGGARDTTYIQVQRVLRLYMHNFTPSGFVVFMAICLFIDKDNYCWPSIGKLVECTGLSESTVRSSVKHLCSLRIDGHVILEVTSRTSPNGRTSSNGYRIFPGTPNEPKPHDVKVIATEKKEVKTEDDPAFGLYKAFKRTKFGMISELAINDKEWKDVRLTIWQMHKAGITEEDVMCRTSVLLRKWPNKDMVTVRSLWKHWETHAKPQAVSEDIKQKVEAWFDDDDR